MPEKMLLLYIIICIRVTIYSFLIRLNVASPSRHFDVRPFALEANEKTWLKKS